MGTQHLERDDPATGHVRAAEVLDHLLDRAEGAIVAGLRVTTSVLGPPPASLDLRGNRGFDGSRGLDLIVVDDQGAVLDAWVRAATAPVVRVEARLLSESAPPSPITFLDLREEHDTHVVVVEPVEPDSAWSFLHDRVEPPHPIARLRRDSMATIVHVDDAMVSMLGWRPEELLGRSTRELLHPDDVQRAIEGWIAMRFGAGSAQSRVRFRHADGHYVWVEVTNHDRLDDPGIGLVVSEIVDVSEEVAQLEALRERERLLARLAGALPIGVCHVHTDRSVVYSNEPFVALLGAVDSADALAHVVDDADRGLVAAALDDALQGRPGAFETGVRRGPDRLQVELTFRPMGEEDGVDGIDGVIVCAADVTDRNRMRAELEHRADHDALTGCLNRAATVTALDRALTGASPVAVAFIDLDGFKAVNDDHGHLAGDELLRIVAGRLRTAIRGADQLGRVGGDEFVVVCPTSEGHVDADDLLARLTAVLNPEARLAGHPAPLRASVGIALSRPGQDDAEAVLGRADAAMYQAKLERS